MSCFTPKYGEEYTVSVSTITLSFLYILILDYAQTRLYFQNKSLFASIRNRMLQLQKRIGVHFLFSSHTYDRVKRVVVQVTQGSLSIPLSITNKMQRYAVFFIAVNAVHVSGCFSVHYQELKLCIQHLVYVKHACCYR